MVTRPSIAHTMLGMAKILSERSTCKRRKVGCILINKHNHIIGSGYNGVCAGVHHCIDIPCPGAFLKSGEGLGACEAIHAEQNALMQCSNVYDIESIYITTSPCEHCIKMLMNTSAKNIYFTDLYPNALAVKDLWLNSNEYRGWYETP